MTEATIDKLPELLKNHISTLKKASCDETNGAYMTESALKVVRLDKVPKEYAKGKGWSGIPQTNDALYISDTGKWFFIEFKNGAVQKAEIYRKLYDSLIMLLEEKIIPDYDFVRKAASYILVYNSDKYPVIPVSESRNLNYSYFSGLAKAEPRLFDVEKFEKYLFWQTHTYTKEQFERLFVTPTERQEELEALHK